MDASPVEDDVADGGAAWEEARACGACGSAEWTPAGAVCGRRYARCRGCGIVRLYDRVAEDRLGLLYAGYYPGADPSPAALRQQLANPTFARRRRRLEAVVPADRRRVLEVGCGDGNFLAHLRAAGWSVEGVEFDGETAALVRRRHGIAVRVGDVADTVPAASPFPVVAAYHVLEHVYRPAAWLAAVRGMLEPGGILHLQVPNHGSMTRWLTGAAWASLMFPQHVHFFTPRTLEALLRRSGFAPLGVSTWDPWHGPGTLAGSVVNQALRMTTGRLPWTDALDRAGADGTRVDASDATGVDGLDVTEADAFDVAGADACGAGPVRRPRLARRVLDALAVPLARAEALAGAGAVVDVLARRE